MIDNIGKLFNADVIVSCYIAHDHIYISPKEEKMFLKLIEWSKHITELKNIQEEQSISKTFQLKEKK